RVRKSLISPGTERMLLEFGKANWVERALKHPERVRQVIDKIKTDGLIPTLEAVFRKLDEPLPLGYSSVGVVEEVGEGVTEFQIGDRVVSNGPHAEMVCVPKNLCAKVPEDVTDDEAVFTVLGSVALQGIRLANPTFGESFIVFGVGLLGLLTVQLLKANGCRVLAVDINEKRLSIAREFGADIVNVKTIKDLQTVTNIWTKEVGVDGAIITATAKGDDIIHQAAQSCRKRGRIILVGVVDLNLRRSDFYEKELLFQVSCSYGPGRYDDEYENKGHDYPIGYVRWTLKRNFEAVLEALATKRIAVDKLITHRVFFEDLPQKYEELLNDPNALGIVIEYGGKVAERQRSKETVITLKSNSYIHSTSKTEPIVGVIGAGAYAKTTFLPLLVKTKVKIKAVADVNGIAAFHTGKKYGAEKVVSDYRYILEDTDIDTVFILVGHHLHARLVCESLEAKKYVFVEKPLCINETELDEIINTYLSLAHGDSRHPFLMIGFNRRFSPHTVKIKNLLQDRIGPLTMTVTVNAGYVPPDHWSQDPERGGGRIIGEACHFIDLLAYIAGSPVTCVSAMMIGGADKVREDKMSIIMSFKDGSIGTVNYFANGSRSYPKEILEVFCEGKVLRMENFRVTRGFGFKGFKSFRTWRQDKGHKSEIETFLSAIVKGEPSPIPFREIINVAKATFAAVKAARTQTVIRI
ncbi:MAG: bi-domain-containing oxidoreductase, partial [Deltaproteobacteria bacterium]|nr:bi-domain-containing oxidoreductase [Deltaproteobacteria bacterium]